MSAYSPKTLDHIIFNMITGKWSTPGVRRFKLRHQRGRNGHMTIFSVKSKGRTGATVRQALIARGLTF